MEPLAVVAGSGIDLTGLLDVQEASRRFQEFPGLVPCGVAGHEGRFLRGACAGRPIILQCGRLHMYEGHDYATVTRPMELLDSWGVRAVVFTNAAGCLLPEMGPGDLMAAERLRLWRYRPWPATPGTLLTDFLAPGCDFIGDYQWMHGPSYETRAEIAALQHLKASAVGMSSAPEVMRCHELGMQAAVVSVITNSCCVPARLTHGEIVAAGRKASARLVQLLRRALPDLGSP